MAKAELLTPLELDFLWESAGSGDLPYPLEVRSHGLTMDERAVLRQRAMAELARRGLVDERGRPEPHVEEFFEILGAPDLSLDSMHINTPNGAPLLAVAAALGTRAVLAVKDERGFHLQPMPADGLASAVVSLLPAAPRGTDKSITVPLEQLLSGSGVDFMQRRGPAQPDGRASTDDDRKALAKLHAQPRLRGGQIGANARSRVGGRSRGPVLSWFDTDSGRYFTQATRGRDGSDWITIAPADVATLRSRLGEMLTRVADSAAGAH
ncbi:ESX secretion-associated protein EspG [Amycolatopsis nigrescens]|uniref:ESX secretion-associated protein EspG n=1 Tax=Amycolatopsis nigrescens TaxID=381445 RepID=UPI000370B644|nr:ESX secretion-associated protein EspG [Amycolatopsis nigrescens]